MSAGRRAVDLVIAGGTVVLPDGPSRVGVAVHHGIIAAIGPEEELPEAGRVLDVGGAVVLPGAIDVHMHYDQDGRVVDGLNSASRSAACGGVTTMVGFLLSQPGRDYTDTLADAVQEVQRDSFIDVGFHMYLRANDVDALAAVPALVRSGVASFKMAMAYKSRGMMCTDEFLMAAMKVIGAAGGAAMVHAECGEAIDYLERSAMASGQRAPTDYSRTRPAYTEAEAITRAATFAQATGCPLYVVHLTSAAALRQLVIAQDLGCDVLAETCPQYLLLTDRAMASQGNLAKIAPPLRDLPDMQALWQAVASGQLPVVASDHAPYPSEKKLAEPDDVFSSPFGMPIVETMLPVLHSEGVVQRGLSLAWLARVSSENPARIMGLYPRKGSISVGADADLCVLDPGLTRKVDASALHSNANYTPFAGIQLAGWPAITIAGGKLLVEDGALQDGTGHARFLAREPVAGRLTDRLPAPTRQV